MKRNHAGVLAAAGVCLIMAFSSETRAALDGGYVLTGAYGGAKTVLIDSTGNVAYEWNHYNNPDSLLNGYSSYLLKNGNLLRTAIVPPDVEVGEVMAPRQGIVEEVEPSGNVVWRFTLANTSLMLHHDIKPMSNGNVLAVAYTTLPKAQMAATGVDTNLLRGGGFQSYTYILSEKILEIDPKAAGGPKIVWEWNLHDHVIKGTEAAAHPELISGSIIRSIPMGYSNQWVHLNGLDYNEELDLVLFSSRIFSELFIIDHGTTTQEAAGHTGGKRNKGGDILYRWGNPGNYQATGATKVSVLHCPNWIPKGYPGEGNIIFFHNNSASTGMGGGSQSQVIEIEPPMDANGNFIKTEGQPFGPTQPTWLYAPTRNFTSPVMSSAFRLKNGNTLAHLAYPGGLMGGSGSGLLVEIDNDKNEVGRLQIALKGEVVDSSNPQTFNPAKIVYYEGNYDGVKKLLGISSVRKNNYGKELKNHYHITNGSVRITGFPGNKIEIFNMQGKKVYSAVANNVSFNINTRNFPSGLYCLKVTSGNHGISMEKFNVFQ